MGWSDGAATALLASISRPDIVRRLICVGGFFNANSVPPQDQDWIRSASAESFRKNQPKVVKRYEDATQDGPDHFPVVFEKTKKLAYRTRHQEGRARKDHCANVDNGWRSRRDHPRTYPGTVQIDQGRTVMHHSCDYAFLVIRKAKHRQQSHLRVLAAENKEISWTSGWTSCSREDSVTHE